MSQETRPVLDEVENLRQLRDELVVQAHLFKAETRERWIELEQSWDRLQMELKPVRGAAAASAADVGAAAKLLVETLRKGYERLRKSLPQHT